MLNFMEKINKESERSGKGDSEISLTPMNLSTMLSNSRSRDFPGGGPDAHRMLMHSAGGPGGRLSDSSMSPGEDVDIDDEEGLEEEEIEERRRAEESSTSRERHASADIRAQFMADLRRLGGNIPTQSGAGDEQAATSTTSSPPPAPPPLMAPPISSLRSSQSEDNNLPPRKRKVSQEHRMAAAAAHAQDDKPPSYNGLIIHEEKSSPEKNSSSFSSSSLNDKQRSPLREESKNLAAEIRRN